MNKFSPYHLNDLLLSGLTEEDAILAGNFEESDKEALAKILNKDLTNLPKGPCNVFTIFDIFDRNKILSYNVKGVEPLLVNGKLIKYSRPIGSSNHIYVPKNIPTERIVDITIPVIITEGEKKTICGNKHGLLTIGLSGVNNWKGKDEEGNSFEIPDLKKINLKGRQITILFDSDIIDNPKVQLAESQLAEYLTSEGAIVRCGRLPSINNKKVGLDDFLVTHGKEALIKILKQARLPKTSSEDLKKYFEGAKSLTAEEINNKIISASNAIALFEDSERSVVITNINKQTGVPTADIKKLINGIRKEKKKTKGDNTIYHNSEHEELNVFNNKLIKKVSDSKTFYTIGNDLYYIKDSYKEEIDTRNLPSLLNTITEVNIDGRYIPLPQNYANVLLASPKLNEVMEDIQYYTENITYDYDWVRVKQGYNPKSKIYFSGEDIKAVKMVFEDDFKKLEEKFGPNKELNKNKVYTFDSKLIELLSDFPFKNVESICNAISLIHTGVLTHMFQGTKPFFSVVGNRPGVGKSYLVEILLYLITGKIIGPISWCEDVELEKKIGARIDISDALYFDNLKESKPIHSKVLESLITSEINEIRKLGKSELMGRKNTWIVAMALNDAIYGEDLLTRLCPIEFHCEEDPRKRRFKKPDLKAWTKENRAEIIGEILGMIETWKSKGFPQVVSDSRNQKWVGIMGGILESNGFKGFMANYKSATTSYTPEAIEASLMFSGKKSFNKNLTIEDLITLAQMTGAFKDKLAGNRSDIAIAKVLKNITDQTIQVEEGVSFILRRNEDKKLRKVVYVAESSYVESDDNSNDLTGAM